MGNNVHDNKTPQEPSMTYDEIMKEGKKWGVDITWEKLNHYKSLGLLPKSKKMPGEKEGSYPASIIVNLKLYHFLQSSLSFTLEEIRDLLDKISIPDSSAMDKVEILQDWLGLSYSHFFDYVVNDFKNWKGEHDSLSLPNVILLINWCYKRYFQTSGLSYLNKSLKEISPEKIAKEWAKEAVKEIRSTLDIETR
ncbi:hypothetical protein ACFL0P_00385 [Candidatus Omnitrophota bacterium]